MLLKQKVVNLIFNELGIKPGSPFSIKGESTPYRMDKSGHIERLLKNVVWTDSCKSCLDLIMLIDGQCIEKIDEKDLKLDEPIKKRGKKK